MDIARLKLLSWLAMNSGDKSLRLDYDNVIYMDLWLGTSMMYGMAQCTRDLAPTDYNRCLHVYIDLIRKFYLKNIINSIKGYKCYLRFQLSPFDIMLSTSSPPPPPRASKRFIVILTVGGCVSFLVVLCLSMWLILHRRGKHISRTRLQEMDNDVLFNDEENDFEKSTAPRSFAIATDNFSDDHKLDEEGFGSVYRGIMRDSNIKIVVKRVSKTLKKGMREFTPEVWIISWRYHTHLVPLIGWCHGGSELPKNSLPWPVKYNIVIGLSVALMYLQHEAEQRVLHRKIKLSNVMLDMLYNARLGDFGLTRLIDESRQLYTTGIAGTLGRAIDSDIYSFGVFLLVAIDGRYRPLSTINITKIKEN
uniref:Protein kinase domain-containing protein n=1 Tax=Leersia perrieri TaxID=77586 RepID=A0A0D9XD15_9ORYZ